MSASRAFCVALLLVGFAVTSLSQASPASPVNVLNLALAGDVTALEKLFLESASETRSSKSDYAEYYDYQIFLNPRPDIAAPIDQWVRSKPNSPHAFTARGLYRYALATRNRSDAGQVANERLKAFSEMLMQSAEDLTKAIELDRDATVARGALIQVMIASGDTGSIQQVARDGLRVNNYSFAVRSAALQAEAPKWGGSFERLSAQTDEAVKLASDSPELKQLQGFGFATLAEGYSANGDSVKALSFAREAEALALDESSHMMLARIYFQAEDYVAAQNHLDQAIALYPARVESMYWNGRIALKNEDLAAAGRWFEQALTLNPVDTNVIRYAAWIHKQNGKTAEARTLYERALSDDGVQDERLITNYLALLVNDDKDFTRAESVAETTGSLFRDSRSLFWYYYGVALAGNRDCRTVAAMKRYQLNCEGAESLCRGDALTGAEKRIRALVDPGRCDDMPAMSEDIFSN